MNWYWRRYHDLSLDELYAILTLRQSVFVVEQQSLFLDADGLDRDAWHLLGLDGRGKIVAYLRVLAPGARSPEPSIGRIVVVPELRGEGIGRDLTKRGMRKALELYPGRWICISAQASLEGFYRKLGFDRTGDLYDEDGVLHVDMAWRGNQAEGL
jgi:ElaA protein